MQITAARLYDYVSCPHRVALDLFGDVSSRTEISPLIRMLWKRGSAYEAEVLGELGETAVRIPADAPDRLEATLSAMGGGAPLILGGRIAADDLLGEPDLLNSRLYNLLQPPD